MLGYAGALTGFPVIAADRDPRTTAAWLARHLGPADVKDGHLPTTAGAEITEVDLNGKTVRVRHEVACGEWITSWRLPMVT